MLAAVAAASVAFLHGGNLVVLNAATHAQTVVMRHAGHGPVRWSADGRLVSSGGRVAGGPSLPTAQLVWAPSGETAAYLTRSGALDVWTPGGGVRRLLPATWGAQAIAWTRGGALAIGRGACRARCGLPVHTQLWLWRAGRLHRVLATADRGVPYPIGSDPQGRVLWWEWPNSGSIAADGVALFAGRANVGSMLMYPDWIVPCGRGIAFAAGGDRNSLTGKWISVRGRDVTRDTSRSWVSPSCSADGATVVAAASRDNPKGPWGREHRALWQLLPVRRRLTQPPRGWTDESPVLLDDGSILFVRTRQTARKEGDSWIETDRGRLELLWNGVVTQLADLTYRANEVSLAYLQFYGHYAWPSRVAVRP